jgi:hypothetical protein
LIVRVIGARILFVAEAIAISIRTLLTGVARVQGTGIFQIADPVMITIVARNARILRIVRAGIGAVGPAVSITVKRILAGAAIVFGVPWAGIHIITNLILVEICAGIAMICRIFGTRIVHVADSVAILIRAGSAFILRVVWTKVKGIANPIGISIRASNTGVMFVVGARILHIASAIAIAVFKEVFATLSQYAGVFGTDIMVIAKSDMSGEKAVAIDAFFCGAANRIIAFFRSTAIHTRIGILLASLFFRQTRAPPMGAASDRISAGQRRIAAFGTVAIQAVVWALFLVGNQLATILARLGILGITTIHGAIKAIVAVRIIRIDNTT